MITQYIMDFLRDMAHAWTLGLTDLTGSSSWAAAGAGIGGAAGQGGRVVALFLDNTGWILVASLASTYLGVWIVTALISILGRRFAGGSSGKSA